MTPQEAIQLNMTEIDFQPPTPVDPIEVDRIRKQFEDYVAVLMGR